MLQYKPFYRMLTSCLTCFNKEAHEHTSPVPCIHLHTRYDAVRVLGRMHSILQGLLSNKAMFLGKLKPVNYNFVHVKTTQNNWGSLATMYLLSVKTQWFGTYNPSIHALSFNGPAISCPSEASDERLHASSTFSRIGRRVRI